MSRTAFPALSLALLCTVLPYALSVENEGDDPLQWLRNSIPGEPGVDYPIFPSVGDSAFSCDGLVFGGYYADPEYDCQAYHVCLQDPVDYTTLYPVSFLCPNGTIFNQELFNCDWWYNVDCAAATGLYGLAEGAFGVSDAAGGSGDAGSCPAANPLSPDQCAGSVSTCWSPGQRDTDCPGNGLCCFDGCANTCDGQPIAKPSNEPVVDEQPGYNYEEPENPLRPPRPSPTTTPRPTPAPTTPRPTTEPPLALYGPPARSGRQGRRFPSRNNRRQGRRVKNRKPVIFV